MLTETQRRDLLSSYIKTEPEFTVNCERYLVSPYYSDQGVVFYAINSRFHNVAAMSQVTPETWRQCNCGLALAYLYNVVLDTLELSVVYSGGRITSGAL